MPLTIESLDGTPPDERAVEIVERKGLGHPDTLCDALAEGFGLALAGFYHEHFGRILPHNVDKVLLFGGAAEPRFGGGSVVEPIQVYLAGRAVREYRGVRVPVEDLALTSSRAWLHEHLHALDADRHVRVQCLIRPGSGDLADLFARSACACPALAGDTSCGVGYAPWTELETIVYQVERRLNSRPVKEACPAIGEDIKVMGVRSKSQIQLTVACAFIGRFLRDLDDYLGAKAHVTQLVEELARGLTHRDVRVVVNPADDPARDSVYLTVTGTSAESGDDGQAGRGNRANGLITPGRPMTLESLAGKHPVTHVGKLYNLAAGLIAEAVVAEFPEVREAECCLVSEIGRPVREPQQVSLRLRTTAETRVRLLPRLERMVHDHLEQIESLWRELVGGVLAADGWPFRRPEADPRVVSGEYDRQRAALVEQIGNDVREGRSGPGWAALWQRVLAAMARVPRHEFVPPEERARAYLDQPLPIGAGQTISQPSIVALMTVLAEIPPAGRVLEIGTGCGYQTAVLAELAAAVYSLELLPELAGPAQRRLARLGYANVALQTGDGCQGWPDQAPFDAILVTAAARHIPPSLVAQLKPGGRLVLPLQHAPDDQQLALIVKDLHGGLTQRAILPVRFVPLETPPN